MSGAGSWHLWLDAASCCLQEIVIEKLPISTCQQYKLFLSRSLALRHRVVYCAKTKHYCAKTRADTNNSFITYWHAMYLRPVIWWNVEMTAVDRTLEHLRFPVPQVLLRLPDLEKGSKGAMVYACSWWDAAHVSEYLKDSSRPIWESLSQGRTELYRDIQQVYCGHSHYLEEWALIDHDFV